jgi:hypothetical protein
MKINSQYIIREIAGEHILINQGTLDVDMTKIISLNATACLLYRELFGKEFTEQDAADILVRIYEISQEQALLDVSKWISTLKSCKVIE